MKKIILVAIATVFSCSQSVAQDEIKSKSFIGLTGGYSKLSGNLTKNDYDNEKSGYSNSAGYNMGIEGAYFFHKYIGIGGIFSQSSFYTKGIQTMSDGYKDAFDVDSTTVSVSGKYSFTNFFVGPYFSYPCKKFTFDARLVGGLTHGVTPQFKIDLEDQLNATFYQDAAKANAFGMQAGIGVRYSIIKNLCVKINIDYYYAKPDFKITNENRVVVAGRLVTEYKEPITMLCLNFGLAYQFGK
jgi:opacity protein-like surface antigen